MKSHLKLKIKRGVVAAPAPHWQDLLDDRTLAKTKLHPSIDNLLASYDLPVWVTQEYRPAGEDWDVAELTSGLDRIYRLILQQERSIPSQLIQELGTLSIVEDVQVGAIAQADLPKSDTPGEAGGLMSVTAPRADVLAEGFWVRG